MIVASLLCYYILTHFLGPKGYMPSNLEGNEISSQSAQDLETKQATPKENPSHTGPFCNCTCLVQETL